MAKYKAKVDDFFTPKKYYQDEVLEGVDDTKLNGFLKLKRNGVEFNTLDVDFIKVDDSTPLFEKSSVDVSKVNSLDKKRDTNIKIASTIGGLAGLGFAFHKKKKFWGYVGYFILGSIAFSLAYQIIPKPKSK